LLRLLATADEAAWMLFVERYTPLIEASCRLARLSHADADEVRSRVLLALVRALKGFEYDPAHSFRGYLRTAVQNTIRTYWKERTRPGVTASGHPDTSRLLEQMPAAFDSLSVSLDDDIGDRLRLVQRVIDLVRRQVNEDTWLCYWLTAIENQPVEEVCRRLGKTRAAVYQNRYKVGKLLEAAGSAARLEPPQEPIL
jgi:RNA polymerase sigma-70 factor (ECF subfamily)